ncbi:FAST kinase domain-containing protein 4 [Anthonomus grandis grandis]|uniref:FAST kinase domain-containing protein 4 n=1 Tax=Anthonomus grandis grandis TaxID=2921223 RepID=UPI002166766A|nr:FAST kinase domain-containing protein 4 [Anthonomus grandis grandis]
MFKFYQKIILQQFKGINRTAHLNRHNGFATATIAETKNINAENNSESEKVGPTNSVKENKMVKTVFASINLDVSADHIKTPFTDTKIFNASSVDELLSISEGTGISRKHALKVVSVLSNWTSTEKIKLSDFERDPRFIKLCKILTRTGPNGKNGKSLSEVNKSEDLSTVLNVTADEEAAKLVGSLTLPQMIKVLVTLSVKRRRSTFLLRALAYNIAASPEQLNIKQCADLFYSIASLNYYDENLFEKAANNIITVLEKEVIKRSAVIGSILTSVGLLRYKNPALLDAISEWIVKNNTTSRPQDIFSLFMTLAVLNYIPSNADHLFKVLVPQLTEEEAGKPGAWLEIVWSLVLLNQANADHLKSVLSEEFINKLKDRRSLTTSAILKLLNIDGAAHYLIKNYKGPQIPQNHEIRNTSFLMTKEKEQVVNCVIDTLKNLIPDNYFRTRVNTGLGFYIDAECAVDKTCNPLPIKSTPDSNQIKIAILAYDYHDMCKGRFGPTGINVLIQKLLSALGYRIVTIPFNEFIVTDKIVNRVQYLENKLKQAIKE